MNRLRKEERGALVRTFHRWGQLTLHRNRVITERDPCRNCNIWPDIGLLHELSYHGAWHELCFMSSYDLICFPQVAQSFRSAVGEKIKANRNLCSLIFFFFFWALSLVIWPCFCFNTAETEDMLVEYTITLSLGCSFTFSLTFFKVGPTNQQRLGLWQYCLHVYCYSRASLITTTNTLIYPFPIFPGDCLLHSKHIWSCFPFSLSYFVLLTMANSRFSYLPLFRG